jgi:L-amino acid N-acyltransferase YncA
MNLTTGRDAPSPRATDERVHRLRDGTKVRVRPILAQDKDGLREGLSRLSPLSRYRRFHGGVASLTAETLRDLTEIDYVNHMAFVAIDADAAGEPGVGVARYIRLTHAPETAEIALTVVDSHQGRGLGALLLDLLMRSAEAHGIRTLRAWVLADNEPMLHLLRARGAIERGMAGGVLRLELSLTARA